MIIKGPERTGMMIINIFQLIQNMEIIVIVGTLLVDQKGR